MKLKLKDPGSAITHGIAMLLAVAGATPLIVKAARSADILHVFAVSVFILTMILLYLHSLPFCKFHRQGEPPPEKNGSHDDLRDDRRQLYTGMPDRPSRPHRLHPLCTGMDCCHHRHDPQRLLDQLPEMAFLRNLYWNGLAVCPGFCTDLPQSAAGRFRMASGRRYYLHYRRCDLRTEASDLQCET